MSAEIELTTASLIIATTAMILAGLQFLQTIIGHVEGFRKCASSVIGPWATLRHRKWRVWELRIETEYTTPHFSIIRSNLACPSFEPPERLHHSRTGHPTEISHRAPDDRSAIEMPEAKARHIYGPTYDIVTLSRMDLISSQPQRCALVKLGRALIGTPLFWDRYLHVNCKLDHTKYPQILRRTIQEERKFKYPPPRSSPRVDVERNSRMDVHSDRAQVLPRSEIRVSWLQLLDVLHYDYASYSRSGPILLQETDAHIAAVAFRQWNWSFMPPDLLRPLATSTLSDIILVALRLGMAWKNLNMESNIFTAYGNGYSITSTETRGLGITFTFTITGVQSLQRAVPPSEVADKSLFGILSGCQSLVKRDFALIDEDRHPAFALMFEGIGIKGKKLLGRLAHDAVFSEHGMDAMILLSGFVPLEGCPVPYNYLPGFRGSAHVTPLHWYEGRAGFLEMLKDRTKSMEDATDCSSDVLKEAYTRLYMLFTNWNYDFLDNWDHSVLEGCDDDRKSALTKECYGVFLWATRYLVARWGERDPQQGITWYCHLVAGHCVNAYHAVNEIDATKGWYEEYEKNHDLRRYHRKVYELAYSSEVGFNSEYHIAKKYVSGITGGKHSIARYLRNKGLKLNEDEIETAWWVMVVKGIAWDMATTGHPAARNRKWSYHPEYVPSKFYHMHIPVWIS